MHPDFLLHPRLQALAAESCAALAPCFSLMEETTEYNQQKVLAAFLRNKVSETHFAGSTGYGYGDRGREVLETVFADVFGAESALVRHTFTCGTHTLAAALFGLLRPGEKMLCATGTPYDTLHPVIGLRGRGIGSLRDFGIGYRQVELDAQGRLDLPAIAEAVRRETPKLVYFQRSRGYTLRPSLSAAELGEAAAAVKSAVPETIVVADNCYGEFVEREEPTQRGVDLVAGSLIKNPGGGLARNGGYIAGRRDLVELCAHRMTAPGLGGEVGATLGLNRDLFMGLFHAPHVVGEALKTATFAAALFEKLGFSVSPQPFETRHDVVQAVRLGSAEALTAFCKGMQAGAPVDAFVSPEPWDMPGYDSKVVMAAGTFTMGASIELSADAPLRAPYAAWMQGGLNFHSAKMGVLLAAQSMLEGGHLPCIQ
ncbi:MAG: methionine gamma-lyase family protein [Oscillospiraceae bacterium]|jgi:cystathionine beta-lyase family protein involved in aluminum resistance|nr:methionine gamma-lyase family protein [Oscillospiraceae bacterium]